MIEGKIGSLGSFDQNILSLTNRYIYLEGNICQKFLKLRHIPRELDHSQCSFSVAWSGT